MLANVDRSTLKTPGPFTTGLYSPGIKHRPQVFEFDLTKLDDSFESQTQFGWSFAPSRRHSELAAKRDNKLNLAEDMMQQRIITVHSLKIQLLLKETFIRAITSTMCASRFV